MTGRFVRAPAALLLVLALALGACGRKGDLYPPEGEEAIYTGTGTYPAPDSVVPQAGESPLVREDEEEPEASPDSGPESGGEGAGGS